MELVLTAPLLVLLMILLVSVWTDQSEIVHGVEYREIKRKKIILTSSKEMRYMYMRYREHTAVNDQILRGW